MHYAPLTRDDRETTSSTGSRVGTELRVIRVERPADDVLVVSLADPDDRPLPGWEPGAHLELRLGNGLLRHYSLCGDVDDRHEYRIAVLREPAGRGGSGWIHENLALDTRVTVTAIRNRFRLTPAREYLFIAGGIGITPILPMVRAAERAGSRWLLTYGGRNRASMAFLDELAALDDVGDRVRVWPQNEFGLLPLADLLGAPRPDAAIYACGPASLLAAVEDACSAWPDGALHVERFRNTDTAGPPSAARASAARSTPEADGNQPIEVVCARSRLTVHVSPDTSVLDAVLAAGIEKDFSCREGSCGTCETTVLEGIPDHRDDVLDDDERAANDTMMICVSRACTPGLTLDL